MIQKPSMTKDKKRPISLAIKIIYILILGFIGWETFTYVSPIKGRVVDAETGKPMKGTNVRAGWVTRYVLPYGGFSKTFKVYATMTDENGEFVLPRTIKLKIPIIERYQGVDMLVYEHEYVSQYIERRTWREKGKIKYYQIALKRIEDDQGYSENIRKVTNGLLGHWLSNDRYKYHDFQFIVEDFKISFKQYPNSHFLEENLRKLANFYEMEMKDHKSALKLNEEFVERFPNSPVSDNAREDIQRLKRLIRKSPGGGDRE